MSNLLFLSWWWPYPASNGSKLRIYHLLRQLSREHRVTLLSFAEPGEATAEQAAHLREFCAQVDSVPKPVYQPDTLKATLGYLSRWPRSLVDVYSPAMAEKVRAVTQAESIEVIIASEIQTMRYLEIAPGVPAILETPEVTSFHDRVDQSSSTPGRFRAQMTLSKLENALKALMRRGIAMTVVSQVEREHLLQFAPPGAYIEVVSNGVDTRISRPDPTIQPQPYSLIYTGSVTYGANLDAVTYFARDVWPLLRARAPRAVFAITGGTGNVDVSEVAAQPGVTFTGYLPNVASAIQKSWALVVPLREGSGTRLKILEAMALGVPVISTSKGAEGLSVRHGENILIADQPAEIADTIGALFEDAPLRTRLAENARALVEREYDWEAISRRMLKVIDTVMV